MVIKSFFLGLGCFSFGLLQLFSCHVFKLISLQNLFNSFGFVFGILKNIIQLRVILG